MRAVAHTQPRDTSADTTPSVPDALLIRRSWREPERFTEVAWAQLSLEEVAWALGIPAGTARSRLHRARRKTRAALADADPREDR
jgi:DNA-directed RNA polymerase specialized sigma24 family protein